MKKFKSGVVGHVKCDICDAMMGNWVLGKVKSGLHFTNIGCQVVLIAVAH